MFIYMPKMLDFTGKRSYKSIYFLLQHCPYSSSNCLYFTQETNQRDIFTQEITPVEIGQTVAKVNLLIVASITALTPIIYNSVYSDLIAIH